MTGAIDISHLEKYVFGDRALLDEILTIFVDQTAMLVSKLSAAISLDDWRLTAHTLKGAARGVGAWTLGDLAEEAEKLGGAAPAEKAEIIDKIVAASQAAVEFAIAYRSNAT